MSRPHHRYVNQQRIVLPPQKRVIPSGPLYYQTDERRPHLFENCPEVKVGVRLRKVTQNWTAKQRMLVCEACVARYNEVLTAPPFKAVS